MFSRRALPAMLAVAAFVVAFAPSASADTVTLSSGVTPVYVTDSVLGGPMPATIVPPCCGAWGGPLFGSAWVSPAADYVGGDGTYAVSFTLPADALNPSLSVTYMVDNSANLSLNGVPFVTRNVPGSCLADFGSPLTATTQSGFVAGVNTLSFTVDNCLFAFPPNATGVDFVATVTYTRAPTSKDQCKKGGWQSFGIFKNQGDCVSFVTTGGKNGPANG